MLVGKALRRIMWSMRHQHWDGHRLEHAPRDTAKNSLLKSRMTVSTHHKQTDITISGDRQNGALHVAAICVQPLNARLDAAACEVPSKLVRGPFASIAALLIDRNDGDGMRGGQNRKCISQRAGSQPAPSQAMPTWFASRGPLWMYGIISTGPPELKRTLCGMRLS